MLPEPMKRLALTMICLMSTFGAYAFDYVLVPDMSQLKWQMTTEGKVYLRNLNQFNGSFQGCCYFYWIDVGTPTGRALWASALQKMASSQSMYFGLESAAVGGQMVHLGSW